MEQQTDTWDAFMIYVLVYRLDSKTKLEWELYSSMEFINMKDCLTYITPNLDISYLEEYTPPTSKIISDNQAIHISLRQIHCKTLFWSIEELITNPITAEEFECERHSVEHTTRLDDEAYQVRLPMRAGHKPLRDSYTTARKKFYQLER
ncbi:hypothetical protein PR048_029332 [Dryococelus australis]|uniref:Uncharacterized protein n=1 Tax=Dryococelus australis TaxID=614101 RepID=A0ABQ9GFK4_9NEOP|nr:hypothetical protein PR048_029332 [Dryococelus australis]